MWSAPANKRPRVRQALSEMTDSNHERCGSKPPGPAAAAASRKVNAGSRIALTVMAGDRPGRRPWLAPGARGGHLRRRQRQRGVRHVVGRRDAHLLVDPCMPGPFEREDAALRGWLGRGSRRGPHPACAGSQRWPEWYQLPGGLRASRSVSSDNSIRRRAALSQI